MYGRAESVIGDLTGALHLRDFAFSRNESVDTRNSRDSIDGTLVSALARKARRPHAGAQSPSMSTRSSPPCAPGRNRDVFRISASRITSTSAFPEVEKNSPSRKARLLQINYRSSIARRRAAAAVGARARARGADQPPLLQAAISSRGCARNHCPNGWRNLIANRGRNFF